ncbi:MAG: pantoate--beta-alanine ligase [Candidatus Tectomicrobia bacterium]|nr:pantoate--beta-alanine ligase [Candidatus Tectomicrobia bacterium]
MKVVESIREMQKLSSQLRDGGWIIGFVPTMGSLHEGHLSLMRRAREECDRVILSIFVNPTQFGAGEDYAGYPRVVEQDLKLALGVGVDLVFHPRPEEIYPHGYRTYVEVEEITQKLCGVSRPTHFRGVTTVVAKLFNIVKPDKAYFGQKDFQQLTVIKRIVKDLNFDIEIVGMPIVREPDGLAMSSRNVYLSPEERQSALCLSRSLGKAKELILNGERSAHTIIKEMENLIQAEKHTRIDYTAICDPETFEERKEAIDGTLIALAVYIGKARLIDNWVVQI